MDAIPPKHATGQSPASSGHYLVLDGIRGVAALSVMIYHYGGLRPWASFENAHVAVDVFFILSGFVLCHAYGARIAEGRLSFADYVIKRLIRLYPMVILSLLIGLAGLILYRHFGLSSYSVREALVATVYNALFIPYFNEGEVHFFESASVVHGAVFPANGVIWSLFFELLANLFLFKLIAARKKTLMVLSAAGFAAMVIIGVLTMLPSYQFGMEARGGAYTLNFIGGLPRVVFAFTAGVLIYRSLPLLAGGTPHIARFNQIMTPVSRYPVVVLLLSLGLFAITPLLNGFTFVASCALAPVLIIAGARSRSDNPLINRICRFLGWISYPLYCLHLPIANLVAWLYYQGGLLRLTSAPVMLIAAILTIIASIAIGLLYDEPVRGFLSAQAARLRR